MDFFRVVGLWFLVEWKWIVIGWIGIIDIKYRCVESIDKIYWNGCMQRNSSGVNLLMYQY